MKLTKRQQEYVDVITEYITQHKKIPTIRKIQKLVGLYSSSSVHDMIMKLESKGFVMEEVKRKLEE